MCPYIIRAKWSQKHKMMDKITDETWDIRQMTQKAVHSIFILIHWFETQQKKNPQQVCHILNLVIFIIQVNI